VTGKRIQKLTRCSEKITSRLSTEGRGRRDFKYLQSNEITKITK